jgi:rubrerythrin
MSLASRMTDLETFLAYSVALEEEAAGRHDELADMMDVHNNPEVATTFRQLAHYSRLHAQEIRDHSTGRKLPKIAPWEFGWEDFEGPETADVAEVDYLMNAANALRIAMGNEKRAHEFYADICENAPSEEVRALSAEFAEEEKGHLHLLQEWLARLPDDPDEATFDPDPPHMPE